MVHIFREISKTIINVVLWGIPVLLALKTDNYNFLWLFALSLIVMVGVQTHYEDLARIEASLTETEDNEYE